MQHKALPGLVVAVLLSLMLGVGYRFVMSGRPHRVLAGETRLRSVSPQDAVWFVLPEGGGRTDITILPAARVGLAGMKLGPGRTLWRGWKVAAFTPGTVRLIPEPSGKPVVLGIKDGYVAIFLGPPKLGIVEEVTGIRGSGLLASDWQRLRRGVGVGNLPAAWQMIQGLEQ